MEVKMAINEARELLEEIPDVDSIIGAWDVYCAHMDGPTIKVGPCFDDVAKNPNPQDQRIGLQMLADIYNRLAPYEDRIVSLFKILDLAHLPIMDEIVRNRLSYLNCYCGEFHTYQATMMTLGLLKSSDAPGKKQTNQKRETAAAKMLASQELQEVKQGLVNAGIIEDGRWKKAVSEFACLATELKEIFGIVGERKQNGNTTRAWKDCAHFAGFPADKKSLESARSCSTYTQHGEIANTIRAICKEVHEKYVK